MTMYRCTLHVHAQALPLEDNLHEWHVNLFFQGATAEEHVPFHLILSFPTEYPSKPPQVTVCTPLPHANVVRRADGTLTICLDMLETPSGKGEPYAGWSSAMSVLSILVQLHAFLSCERLHYMDGMGSMDRALQGMRAFECAGCTHADGTTGVRPVRTA